MLNNQKTEKKGCLQAFVGIMAALFLMVTVFFFIAYRYTDKQQLTEIANDIISESREFINFQAGEFDDMKELIGEHFQLDGSVPDFSDWEKMDSEQIKETLSQLERGGVLDNIREQIPEIKIDELMEMEFPTAGDVQYTIIEGLTEEFYSYTINDLADDLEKYEVDSSGIENIPFIGDYSFQTVNIFMKILFIMFAVITGIILFALINITFKFGKLIAVGLVLFAVGALGYFTLNFTQTRFDLLSQISRDIDLSSLAAGILRIPLWTYGILCGAGLIFLGAGVIGKKLSDDEEAADSF